jgi:hypothetical protein
MQTQRDDHGFDPIERLARRTGHSVPQAQKIYDAEYARLREADNDPTFRQALALRRTREVLLARQKARAADEEDRTPDLFAA